MMKDREKRLKEIKENYQQCAYTHLSAEHDIGFLLETIEQLNKSLETAKADYARHKKDRKWDDYDKLNKKYLKKCQRVHELESQLSV